jgi:Glycosyltransferase family 9 (heptosyltransferase)
MRPKFEELVEDERRDGLVCLVLLLGGLDELLLATPAIRALKGTLPRHRLILASHPAVGSAAVQWQLADGFVPARPWYLPRQPSPDVAVNLTDAPESDELLLQLRPRKMVAFANPALRVRGPWRELTQAGEQRLVEHRRVRWCRLVASVMDVAVDTRDGLLSQTATASRAADPTVVIHPGGPSGRRWAAPRFAAMARELDARGMRVRVVGTSSDADLVCGVTDAAGLAPSAAWLPGTVGELTGAIAAARLVVAGDTAVGHLAAACAVPGIHIHTTTSPRERGPLAVGRRCRVLGGVDPAATEPTVDQALDAVMELVESRPSQAALAA